MRDEPQSERRRTLILVDSPIGIIGRIDVYRDFVGTGMAQEGGGGDG